MKEGKGYVIYRNVPESTRNMKWECHVVPLYGDTDLTGKLQNFKVHIIILESNLGER